MATKTNPVHEVDYRNDQTGATITLRFEEPDGVTYEQARLRAIQDVLSLPRYSGLVADLNTACQTAPPAPVAGNPTFKALVLPDQVPGGSYEYNFTATSVNSTGGSGVSAFQLVGAHPYLSMVDRHTEGIWSLRGTIPGQPVPQTVRIRYNQIDGKSVEADFVIGVGASDYVATAQFFASQRRIVLRLTGDIDATVQCITAPDSTTSTAVFPMVREVEDATPLTPGQKTYRKYGGYTNSPDGRYVFQFLRNGKYKYAQITVAGSEFATVLTLTDTVPDNTTPANPTPTQPAPTPAYSYAFYEQVDTQASTLLQIGRAFVGTGGPNGASVRDMLYFVKSGSTTEPPVYGFRNITTNSGNLDAGNAMYAVNTYPYPQHWASAFVAAKAAGYDWFAYANAGDVNETVRFRMKGKASESTNKDVDWAGPPDGANVGLNNFYSQTTSGAGTMGSNPYAAITQLTAGIADWMQNSVRYYPFDNSLSNAAAQGQFDALSQSQKVAKTSTSEPLLPAGKQKQLRGGASGGGGQRTPVGNFSAPGQNAQVVSDNAMYSATFDRYDAATNTYFVNYVVNDPPGEGYAWRIFQKDRFYALDQAIQSGLPPFRDNIALLIRVNPNTAQSTWRNQENPNFYSVNLSTRYE